MLDGQRVAQCFLNRLAMAKKKAAKKKSSSKADRQDPRIVSTRREVAAHFDVSISTIDKWRQMDPPMPGGAGRWSLTDIEIWRQSAAFRSAGEGKAASESVSGLQSKIRETELAVQQERLRKVQRENSLAESKSLPKEAVTQFVTEFLRETRRLVQGVPGDFAQGYPKELRATIKEDLGERLDSVLQALHSYVTMAADLETEGDK